MDNNSFTELIVIIKEISAIYKRLYELEINGKRNSSEYKHYLELLISKINQESKFCDNYQCSSKSLIEATFYLEKANEKDKDKLFNPIIRFANISKEKLKITEQILDGEVSKIFNAIFGKDIPKPIPIGINLQQEVENDFHNAYIHLLYKKATSLNLSKNIKDQLLKLVYNEIFSDCSAEYQLINNNFDLNKPFYFQAQLVFDFYHMDRSALKDYQYNIIDMNLKDKIHELLGIGVSSLEIDDDSMINHFLKQTIFRSALLLATEEQIKECKDFIGKLCYDSLFLSRGNDGKKPFGLYLLSEACENHKDDKQNAIFLSARARK